MFVLVKKLLNLLGSSKKNKLIILSILLLTGSLFEMLGLGAVIPFLVALTDPSELPEYATKFLATLDIVETSDIQIFFTLLFVSLTLLAGLFRIYLSYYSNKVAYDIAIELSSRIFIKSISFPYEKIISKNSSELISFISTKSIQVVTGIISPLLMLFTSGVMSAVIISVLLYIEPIVTLVTSLIIGLVYTVVLIFSKKYKLKYGDTIKNNMSFLIQHSQEVIGGIRDVILDNSKNDQILRFSNIDVPLRLAQRNVLILSQTPRFFIEAVGTATIALVALAFTNDAEASLVSLLPVFAAIALGAQRLLPQAQQVYASLTSMTSSKSLLIEILDFLTEKHEVPAQDVKQLTSFSDCIRLENVSFKYKTSRKDIFKEISIEIRKGESIGIVGATGCGKSTFLDLLMGLLQPNKGHLVVDGFVIDSNNVASWHKLLAHVPQYVFLKDTTIAENIAFNVPLQDIDFDKLTSAAKAASILNDIKLWPMGFDTEVGERGVMLSGGQRQRIGIARALYKSASILFLDEATSALDNDTEKSVMDAITDTFIDTTIIIIAHRLSTLRKCTKIVDLSNNKITIYDGYDHFNQNLES